LVSDIVGYSRLAGADEDRILARLRALRSDLIDPTISVHHGRIVKRTGDGAIVADRAKTPGIWGEAARRASGERIGAFGPHRPPDAT
jgi:class 3 adenylate cyclase